MDTLLSKSVQKKSTDYKEKWTDYQGNMDNGTQQILRELYNLFSNNACAQPSFYQIIETNVNEIMSLLTHPQAISKLCYYFSVKHKRRILKHLYLTSFI